MDVLTQTKLSLAEWKAIEEPVPTQEKAILNLIRDAYRNVDLRSNATMTMFTFTKIEQTPENEFYLYQKYLKDEIKKMVEKYGGDEQIRNFVQQENTIKKLKSADAIRIKNIDANIVQNKKNMFEFILLEFCGKIIRALHKKKGEDTATAHAFYLYTLIQWKKNSIVGINSYMTKFVDLVIQYGKQYTNLEYILKNAYEFIEKNAFLFQYEDLALFTHQKELFSFCESNQTTPKLVLYIAPTGTGKTLSPIGLSEGYKIIFVCVARHVGLALAKSAISVGKRVAFAFGCETSSDVRLHYYSAIDYTINKRSGGIGKVDHSVGNKVEIMICDVQSYLVAMYYMLAFNSADTMLTYWDEPTMTMDYEDHPLHATIHKNWVENKIPNMVLSCATLPQEEEIQDVLQDFRGRFSSGESLALVHTITSYDCRKSIPILNKDGMCVLPHTLCDNADQLIEYAGFCENNKTLLRYFDLREILRFIEYAHFVEGMVPAEYRIANYFSGISEITMNSLKIYYLVLLKHIDLEEWTNIYKTMTSTQHKKFGLSRPSSSAIKKIQSLDTKSPASSVLFSRTTSVDSNIKPLPEGAQGILLTTVDAHTLTDGPTIFLAEEVEKIGVFYMKQTKIPDGMLQKLVEKITKNEAILKRIESLDRDVEAKLQIKIKTGGEDTGKKGNKAPKEKDHCDPETEKKIDQINNLRKELQMVSLDSCYIPNTVQHQTIWTPTREVHSNAFMPNVEEETVKEIMDLDVDKTFKVLALLGIGVLVKQPSIAYEEIIKRLAQEQRLFLILASSDYVYGTNYQFCHGMIGKDLKNMTPQKTLQAMGRIGRNNIQQEYTVRFRDDEMIRGLFVKHETNMEAMNMNRLFCE